MDLNRSALQTVPEKCYFPFLTMVYSACSMETGTGSASSKGCAIRQVEILPNKLLTTAFEASLGCVAVM